MNNQKSNNLEQEILEFVRNHAIAQNFEAIIFGQKKFFTNVKVFYPDDLDKGHYYFDDFPTPNNPEKMKKILDQSFKNITQEIIKNPKRGLTEKEIVYKVCPRMLCGDNPCSCKEE